MIFGLGSALVALAAAHHLGLGEDYPLIEVVAFPYAGIVGVALMLLGYGVEAESKKHGGSGGVDGAPGMGASKKGTWGDGPFGDGGGDSGGS